MKQLNPGFHAPFVCRRRELLYPIGFGEEFPLGPQGFDLAVVLHVRRPVNSAILAGVGFPHRIVGILTTPKGAGRLRKVAHVDRIGPRHFLQVIEHLLQPLIGQIPWKNTG